LWCASAGTTRTGPRCGRATSTSAPDRGPPGVPCAVVRPDMMLALDQAHVWHPYSAMPATDRPLAVDSARGVRLRLAEEFEGQRGLAGGVSAWWSAIHGYAHPVRDAAVRDPRAR